MVHAGAVDHVAGVHHALLRREHVGEQLERRADRAGLAVVDAPAGRLHRAGRRRARRGRGHALGHGGRGSGKRGNGKRGGGQHGEVLGELGGDDRMLGRARQHRGNGRDRSVTLRERSVTVQTPTASLDLSQAAARLAA